MQAFKLVNRINFKKIIRPDNKLYSSDSKPNNKNNKSNIDANIKPTTINKAIEYNLNDIEILCDTCIESKHIRIVKLKKIILIIKRLQEIYTVLYNPHKHVSLLEKNYIALLLNKFTCKS